jgi:two-component system, OmpR family, KDP operon response regulator KdpE
VTRILLVDDDRALARALSINLRARRYDVDVAATGGDALRLAARQPPDAVILDLGLPDMDGADVIAGLVGWTSVPIIVLSARDAQAQKVHALDAGAVDFVVKPFGMDELLARLRAALRRTGSATPGTAVVRTSAFTLDLAAKRATRGGSDVHLTPTEWHLLEVLARHPGRLVGHQQLLREVWGPGYEDQAQYLRVYIGALRKKLEPVPAAPVHLLTEPGMGYRLEV